MRWRGVTLLQFVSALIVAVVAIVVATLGFKARMQSNDGRGSDWVCSYPGKGDPICVKRTEP